MTLDSVILRLVQEIPYSFGILNFTRLLRLVYMVNVTSRLADSIAALGRVEFVWWLIYRVSSGPGKDSIFYPGGQDFLDQN